MPLTLPFTLCLFSLVALFSIFRISINMTVRLFILSFFCFLLLRIFLFLLLPILDLVLNKIVECCNGSNQTAEIDCHELIIRLDAHCSRQLATV